MVELLKAFLLLMPCKETVRKRREQVKNSLTQANDPEAQAVNI